jgi:hypothetical protein
MLAEFGPEAAPYLLAAARDADDLVRQKAYSFLAGIEPIPEEALQICLAALVQEREPTARATAAESLGAMAYLWRETRLDHRRSIIASLEAAGRDRSPIVRYAVMRAMVGANAVTVDPSPWLEDSSRSVRLAAAEAILRLTPKDRGRLVPILQAMIVQADPARTADMDRVLALLMRADPAAGRGLVPTLIAWLRHDDATVRTRVIGWLLRLGPMAQDAIPALEGLLHRGPPSDRTRVAFAIVIIDPTACEQAAVNLLALLRDVAIDPRERIHALGPLGVLLNQSKVPARVRDDVQRTLLTIPDQPGVHPEFARRVRQFLEQQEQARARPPAGAVRRVSFQPDRMPDGHGRGQ